MPPCLKLNPTMSRYSTKNVMLLSSNAQYFQYISLSALLLVDFAKKIISTHGSVKICSVCPRLKEKTQERIAAFNAGLAVVSAEKKCSFVDDDNYFKTKSGSINECLLAADGVHLNTSGTHNLIKNIGLTMCSKEQRLNKQTEHKDRMVKRSRRPDAGQHNRTCYNCWNPNHGTHECHCRSLVQSLATDVIP